MNILPAVMLSRGFVPPTGGRTADDYGDVIEGIANRVAWWRFGEAAGASVAVDEVGTQNGAYQGGITFGQPALPTNTDNTDINLNGTNAFIDVTNHANYQIANGTMLIWFRPTSLTANRTLLSKDASGLAAGDFMLWYVQATNHLRFQMEEAGALHQANATGALTAGTKYCAAIQWGTGGMKLYLTTGGPLQLVASNAFAGGMTTNTRSLRIGASQYSGAAADFFVGDIGDVIIWNRQLSVAEIESATQAEEGEQTGGGEYEAALMGLTPAIYLKLDEASGTTVADSSGNARTGTITGTPTAYRTAALATSIESTNLGLNLGNAASISIPHATADAALTFPSNWSSTRTTAGTRFIADATVAMWFQPNSLPAGSNKAVIFAKSNAETPGTALSYTSTHPIIATSTITGGSWEAYIDSAGAVHIEVRSFRGRPCRIRTPAGAVAAGTKYHLVVQLSYAGVTAWLNGAKFEDGYPNPQHVYGLCANIRGLTHINNFAWTIGKAAWSGSQADLQVDEFAVFLRAPSQTLSQADVSTLAEQIGTPTPLVHFIWGQRTINANAAPHNGNIQAAIDACSTAGGGTVTVNPGTYTATINMKNNVRLKKAGTTGTVTINGRIQTTAPSVQTLSGVGTGTVATGGRVLTISNTRNVGDVVVIRGTSTLRHDRRFNTSGESNDPNIHDGEAFIIESRTGSDITFEGNGAAYEFTQANRLSVLAFTPITWIAVEGLTVAKSGTSGSDIPVDFLHATHIRVADCILKSDGHSNCGIAQYSIDANLINLSVSNPYSAGVAVGGTAAIAIRHGSKDVVAVNVTVVSPGIARGIFDCFSNDNFAPITRGELHGCIDTIGDINSAVDLNLKIGLHGSNTDSIYWNGNVRWGGIVISGWKQDWHWMVTGNGQGSGVMNPSDGLGDSYIRQTHHFTPGDWFRVFEGSVGVERNHFEDITVSATPAGTLHNVRYGSGANVNTYRNVASPWTTGTTAWQLV